MALTINAPHPRRRWAIPALCGLLALAILAPALPRGYLLSYDMSFVPRQTLLSDSLGLGSGLPRAVPADALVALATTALPGDLLQKVILFLAVFAAAWGAARLTPSPRLTVQAIAAVLYAWNAYLAERLLIGHWGLLVAYAALPWIAIAAQRLRDQPSGLRAWARLVVTLAPAVITPTGGLLGAGAALAAAGRRRALGVLAVAVTLNAPWWLPAILNPYAGSSDPAAVTAFAARGENWGGPVLSVLGLGGIWNAQVTPASRGTVVQPLFTLLIVAVAVWGLRVWRRRERSGMTGLAALAGLGLLLALAAAVPGLADALAWAITHVPGAGLLRDGQKWAAWWALLLAPAFALGVADLARRAPDALGRRSLLVGALLLPVAVLPDLAWGASGALRPAHYPAEWEAVRQILATDRRPGDVVALPLSTYRSFAWNRGRTQLDPAPRHLPRAVVIADSLKVGPLLVRGEDPRSAQVRRALGRGEPLGRLGIGWVLVEHRTPGPDLPALRGLTTVHAGEWLTLYRAPGPVRAGPGWSPATPWVLTVDGIALILVVAALALVLLPSSRSWERRHGNMEDKR